MSTSEPLLPPCDDLPKLRALFKEEAPWRRAMAVIAERHALPSAPHARPKTGSCVVFFVGEAHVVKLYAPMWRAQLDTEADLLPRVHGRLGVATPELVARGDVEGWPYIVMRRLGGAPAHEVWSDVCPRDRAAILETLGATLHALHALPTEGARLLAPSWPELVARKRAGEDEARRAYLDPLAAELLAAPLVMVHADVTHEHVLVEKRAGRHEMTGLFDFADARLAPREYDLVAPAAFLVRQDPALARALLRGMGVPDAEMTEAFARRLFAFELVHLWADLARDAAMVGTAATTMDELARAFWPIAGSTKSAE